jgi:hypothetical protein
MDELHGIVGMDSLPVQPVVKVKITKKQPAQKKIWIVTYGASGPNITNTMLRMDTKISADECYTTTDKGLKYTLLHLKKYARDTQIKAMMEILYRKHGIIQSQMAHSSPILSFNKGDDGDLRDHIIFQWIVRDMNLKPPYYEEWISEEKEKGMLNVFKHNGADNAVTLVKMQKEQVIKRLIVAEKKLAELSGQEIDEYDVVKKQRTIQAANDFVGEDVSSVLLGSEEAAMQFKLFSSEVISALQSLCIREVEIHKEEEAWMADDLLCQIKKRVGYVYAVGNVSLGRTMVKIGATWRDSPWPRIKELSCYFPTDFHIIALVQCTNPFEIEKKVHMHFADKRVWRESTGRKTELFIISEEEISSHFAHLNQELLLDA